MMILFNSFRRLLLISLKKCFFFSFHSAYEILFSDVLTGVQIPGGTTQFKGADWASWTMTLGWAVQVSVGGVRVGGGGRGWGKRLRRKRLRDRMGGVRG